MANPEIDNYDPPKVYIVILKDPWGTDEYEIQKVCRSREKAQVYCGRQLNSLQECLKIVDWIVT